MSPVAPIFVHASAAVVAEAGVIVRGPSGSGKTSLVLSLVAQARRDGMFARVVADDRVGLARYGERLVARPHPAASGLIERRFLGVVPVVHEPACVVRLVVDLVAQACAAAPVDRLPEPEARRTTVAGVVLPRLRLASGGCGEARCALILYQLASARLRA